MSRYCHRVGADAQKKKTRDERSSPKPKKAPPQWAEQSLVSSDAAAVQERRRRLVVWRSTSMRSKRVPRSAGRVPTLGAARVLLKQKTSPFRTIVIICLHMFKPFDQCTSASRKKNCSKGASAA
ncbi:hypothetical protein HPB52_023371 [Rhipicephalus sanguineus]|uniref:Uncharacterized protein n=1 Tax=Rhipicephalus sanguineus TaxID=34632 RepID=A0A9D4QGD4_RHISA|nr:hypothetical protein HPB52_023371 [Rhipicephalus sanguineus]